MGPVFYLVQCDGALRPISAMILGNWPHEFQPGPCASGAGDGATHHGARPFALGARGGLGAALFGPILKSVPRSCPIRKLAATACRGRRWVFCEDGLKEKEIGTSNRSAHIFARERCPPSRGGSLFLPALPRICLHRRHEISTSTRTTRENNEGRQGARGQRRARRARRERRRA